MKRTARWLLGLSSFTAALLILLHGVSVDWSAIAQAPSPTPTPVESPAPSPAVTPTPAPEAPPPPPTEDNAPTPTPIQATPPGPVPNPEATPGGPVPNPEATPTPTPTPVAPALPLAAEPYVDPGNRFEVGILDGYTSSTVAGIPLFEAESGDIAYTVAVRPRATDSPLNEGALTQVAIDTLRQGEGFTSGVPEPAPNNAAKFPWTGTLTTQGPPQPIQGLVLSRQVPDRVLVLIISATEAGAGQLEAVYSSLESTLQMASPAT